MQFYACNPSGHLVEARSAQRRLKYLCPECRSPLGLRGGPFRRLHFYHLKSSQCRHAGKSPEHLHIQKILQNLLQPEIVYLEYRFSQIARIADVVWPAKKLIFEVQVSPISAEEVKARCHDYQQIGYRLIWIFHDRRFNRYHLTPAEISLQSAPHYFTNINSLGKGFFYDQYALINQNKRIKRSSRFPVSFKELIYINNKQLPRQMPQTRREWQLSFKGDLLNTPFDWTAFSTSKGHQKSKWVNPYKILLNLLLEKTTL